MADQNESYSPVIDCNTFCYQVVQFRQRFEPAEEERGGRGGERSCGLVVL